MTPDPKPRRRFVASRAGWDQLRRAKLGSWPGLCRNCGYAANTLHHLVGRDLGGDDVSANLIPLCSGPGTRDCHGQLERHEPGWKKIAGTVRAGLSGEEYGYVVTRRNRAWLDRHYPSPVIGPEP